MTTESRLVKPTFQQVILTLQHFGESAAACCCSPTTSRWAPAPATPPPSCVRSAPSPGTPPIAQPSRRPPTAATARTPNRLQHYYQFQVVMKPSPPNIVGSTSTARSRARHRPDGARHPLRRGRLGVPDAGRLGPGLGGLAQRHGVTSSPTSSGSGGLDCKPVLGEITYGIERLAMYLQGVENVYDLVWWSARRAWSPTATSITRTRSAIDVQLRAQQRRLCSRYSTTTSPRPGA